MIDRQNRGAARMARLAGVVITAIGTLATLTVAQPRFEYAAESDALVIQMSRNVGIVDPDSPPLVRVYGDGLVRIHYPAYMRRAGDYTITLDEAELRNLIATIVDGGLVEFNRRDTLAEMARDEPARRRQSGAAGPLTTRFDEETMTLEVRLSRYAPPAGAVRQDVRHTIVWSDARDAAARFPTIGRLQTLATVEARLQALAERTDAVKVPN